MDFYPATPVRTLVINRPAGLDRSSPSRQETRYLALEQIIEQCRHRLAVRLGGRDATQASVGTLTAVICFSTDQSRAGRSLPVNLSRYCFAGSAWISPRKAEIVEHR